MTILRKLFEFNVDIEDLKTIYVLYIRSIVEQSCVVWASSLTAEEEKKIERIQKIAFRIILKERYISYENALSIANLPTLKNRRTKLCLKFALKSIQNSKTNHMFPENNNKSTTRSKEKYSVPFAYTNRFKHSAIPSMARQLNNYTANQ